MVDDVAAFALTNFTKRARSPLCTKGLRYANHAPIACFARQASRTSAWSEGSQPTRLTHIADVGLRRSALYWARELMHAFGARDRTSLTETTDISSGNRHLGIELWRIGATKDLDAGLEPARGDLGCKPRLVVRRLKSQKCFIASTRAPGKAGRGSRVELHAENSA